MVEPEEFSDANFGDRRSFLTELITDRAFVGGLVAELNDKPGLADEIARNLASDDNFSFTFDLVIGRELVRNPEVELDLGLYRELDIDTESYRNLNLELGATTGIQRSRSMILYLVLSEYLKRLESREEPPPIP